MARICPQCSQENSDQSVFCVRCGFKFVMVEDVPTPVPATNAIPNFPYAGYAAQENNAPTSVASQAPEPSQPPAGGPPFYGPPSGLSAYGQPGSGYGSSANDPYVAPGSAYPQQQQIAFPGKPLPPGVEPPPGQGYSQSAAQPTTVQGLPVVQRAFAGKGTPLIHASWLLDGKQVSPEDVRSGIAEKVQLRHFNEVKVSQERLSEREAVLEERSYVRIERAPANVFIYVTSFGGDLYISRTTTVQPTLSPVRIAAFGILFLFMLIGFIASAAGNLFMTVFSAILFVFFLAIALHSLVLWLTEKDFLVYLRPNVLNDFRLDDGAILEHIADRSIREAAEELELDTAPLSAPAYNYPARQALHLF